MAHRRMLNWFSKDLKKVLGETKTLKIRGTKFIIKKVSVIDHVKGAQVMMQVYDQYKTGNAVKTPSEVNEKKIKEHYSQVLVAGVVHPRLKHKEDQPGIMVDDLFVDWEIVNKLYEEIMTLSYGKKKMKQLT